MIDKITINNIATFKTEQILNPKKINYIYGGNGTGKTSISNVLNNPIYYPNSTVSFSRSDVEVLVYNKNFVEENFTVESKIKGIYTLGKDSNEAVIRLEEIDREKVDYQDRINNKKNSIKQLKEDKTENRNYFINLCWDYKKKFADVFSDIFKGYLNSKEKFLELCNSITNVYNETYDIDDLVSEYSQLFNSDHILYDNIDLKYLSIDINTLEGYELFQESLMGKDSLKVSDLIKLLDNSDWVYKGLTYVGKNDHLCPFCQQEMGKDLIKNLLEYFDESYMNKIDKLTNFSLVFKKYIFDLENDMNLINVKYNDNFDLTKLKSSYQLFKSKLGNLSHIIEKKLNKPSEIISLEINEELLNFIEDINKLNIKINEWNNTISNIEKSKNNFENKIFGILNEKILTEKTAFNKKDKGFNKGIISLNESIEKDEEELRNLKTEETKIRKKMSGITNTIEEINSLLKKFGFKGFLLKEFEDKFYEIVRPDGKKVKDTLSEGEHRFISFLYFYQLVNGTYDESGFKKNRIIVIDDPISSLDSNILFIVNTLTKKLINHCLKNEKNIEQIFVLTHNVYFHKEITFLSNRREFKKDEVTYSIIKKYNETSIIENHESNPIKTTYQLLWDEVKETNLEKNKSIVFNTIRRILEYYFNIIGHLDYEKTINQIEDDEEKYVAQSMLSVINDQSHFITDDLVFIVTDEIIDKYLIVFKKIFEITGHIEHYNMMMKNQ